MSILVLTTDDEAAESLCSALTRNGETNRQAADVRQARSWLAEPDAAVLVADSEVEGFRHLIELAQEEAPWVRVYLITAPTAEPVRSLVPTVFKPFDAAEFAALLSRDRELAELDHGRRSVQAEAHELASLVEASFEGIIGLGADGKILSWNPGAEKIYGYEASEVIGHHVRLLSPDSERRTSDPPLAPLTTTETERRRKDGSAVRVLVSRAEVQLPAPRLAFAEVSLDITARHRLERELEHSNRLASIGRIAASMSHEINNPLSVIQSSSIWVADVARNLKDTDLLEAAEDMKLASSRIAGFVEHICGFARRARTELSMAPLRTTIDMALRMVRPRAVAKQVALMLELDEPADQPVPQDVPRLAQAVINILANAVDAAATGGKHVVLRVVRHEETSRIQVDDTGPGIPEEIRHEVFEPFSTTKPFGEGTGLGLALARQILEDHNGSVELSPLKDGTRAELIVPNSRTTNAAKPRLGSGPPPRTSGMHQTGDASDDKPKGAVSA